MQTSLFEINLFVPATTPENISKSKHSTSTITAYMSDEDVDWGDIYAERRPDETGRAASAEKGIH